MNYDIVKRLQDPPFGTDTSERLLMKSAADRIEALEAALAKSDALADVVRNELPAAGEPITSQSDLDMWRSLAAYREARKKLQGKEVHPD